MGRRKKDEKVDKNDTVNFVEIASGSSDLQIPENIETTQLILDHSRDDLSSVIPVCYVCEMAVLKNGKAFIECHACQSQTHIQCIGISRKVFNELQRNGEQWCCKRCQDLTSTDVVEDANITHTEVCKFCKNYVTEKERGLFCEAECNSWYHASCVGVKPKRYKELQANSVPWSCNSCRMKNLSIQQDEASDCPTSAKSSVTWGDLCGVNNINSAVNGVYHKVAGWIPNMFLVPSGKEGKDFIEELTLTLKHFSDCSPCQEFSITSFLIMMPLILQKPSKNSKTVEHKSHLSRRLALWRAGNLDELVRECEGIQKRLRASKKPDQNHTHKVFSRLMLEGKVNAAMKWLTSKSCANGSPVELNDETIRQLKLKHPDPKPADDDCLLQGPICHEDSVRFDNLSEESIYNSARSLKGSCGPSGQDSDGIKRILCSKSFGKNSKALCYEIARIARRLCCEDVDSHCLQAFTACRLVPLNKDSGTGIRPIGIGEVLKRIIGRAVMWHLKPDVMEAAGPLQACSGLQAGCEAAIHSMRDAFARPETECVLLIDATNAFNSMNRNVALHNVRYVCPSLSKYVQNTYNTPVDLHIRDGNKTVTFKSGEGTTQGDPPASGWYAISTIPIIEHLKSMSGNECHQAWFADDSTAAGSLSDVCSLWTELQRIGPGYGYFPNSRKTVLIVKESLRSKAVDTFGTSGIIITTEGQKHLGAVIGSATFRRKYVSDLVSDWVKELQMLSEIAQSDPHAAYSAFTHGLLHKWTYFQRTIPDSAELYQPMEDVIRNTFIPSLTGNLACSDTERNLFALPCRLGGLGIPNPVTTAQPAYEASASITQPLVQKILSGDMLLDESTVRLVEKNKKEKVAEKEIHLIRVAADVKKSLPDHLRRLTELNSEKGASCWLTTLPLLNMGFYLNKKAFRDAICMRYGWKIENMASFCVCGTLNSIDHALTCPRGGFVIRRHNELRDLEAEMLNEVCISVTKEPVLQPLSGEIVRGNQSNEARLDVSAIGFWRPQERTFLDVRVFDPNSKSYRDQDPAQVYRSHENQKKAEYGERVTQIERGSLTPLVFSTTGGWSKETSKFHRHLAALMAEKRGEEYSVVMGYIRRRLRFTLLRTTLESLTGARELRHSHYIKRAWKVCDIDMNTIDYGQI